MADAPIAEFISVRGRFRRSVNLERDWRDPTSVLGYVATPSVREIAERVTAPFHGSGGPRAWSIIGPYGAGKSAFALFLCDMLARRPSALEAAEDIARQVGLERPLIPVILTGRRSGIVPSLLAAYADAFDAVAPQFASALRAVSGSDSINVGSYFEEGQSIARERGYGGVLVVIDELGKFVEHASLHPESDDLFVLQELAEFADRQPGRCLVLTILHTAMGDYLRRDDSLRHAEWRKISGRFAEISFHLPVEQVLQLIGDAFDTSWPSDLEARYAQHVQTALSSGALAEAHQRLPLDVLLPRCLPLDPVTSLMLFPLFRGSLAQNERSLFSFLCSAEPYGFEVFRWEARWSGDRLPIFRVDRLYDYVVSALGSAALLGDRSRRWAEIASALDRLPSDVPECARAIIKAVGLIGIYGEMVGLRADEGTLALALGNEEGVRATLDLLERLSIVVRRRHRSDYALWEGSDVDLDDCLRQALDHVVTGSLADRLKRTVALRPIVARAHYIRTGTLRFFDVDVIDGSIDRLRSSVRHERDDDRGHVIYVLAPDERSRSELVAAAMSETGKDRHQTQLHLFAFPTHLSGLEEAIRELEAWQWISSNVIALRGDPVARKEVRARLSAAEARLGRVAGQALGLPGYLFDPLMSDWILGGEQQPPRTPRQFSTWLSRLCDDAFACAPVLANELLNRDQLSSAAAKARRNLLEAMIDREALPRLGFEGAPAEATMYEAMLREGGFHVQLGGIWRFVAPIGTWQKAWQAAETFLEGAVDEPRRVDELYKLWRQPPLGLRYGPMPVLLLALLLAKRDEVVLYEQGTYVPEIRIQEVERMLRRSEDFSVRFLRLSEHARGVLQTVSRELWPSALSSDERHTGVEELVSIARPLVTVVGRLVPYARQTRRCDDPFAAAVRQTVMRASDPVALVFQELPALFGVTLAQEEEARSFAVRLRAAIVALERTYPELLDEIGATLCSAFALDGQGENAANELRQRARTLSGYGANARLTLFIREASREARDWRESLARAVMDGRPPAEWTDSDVGVFRSRLLLLADEFARLEELVGQRRSTGSSLSLSLGILDGKFTDARTFVNLTDDQEQTAEAMAARVAHTLQEGATAEQDDHNVRLAALALAAAREIERGQKGDG